MWVLQRVRHWYPMNSTFFIGRVLSQFKARWWGWYIALCHWFPQKEQNIWTHIPEVISLVKIILVMLALNAPSVTLIRVKSYLCPTMSNDCLNHLLTWTLHKELVSNLTSSKSPMTLWIELRGAHLSLDTFPNSIIDVYECLYSHFKY